LNTIGFNKEIFEITNSHRKLFVFLNIYIFPIPMSLFPVFIFNYWQFIQRVTCKKCDEIIY